MYVLSKIEDVYEERQYNHEYANKWGRLQNCRASSIYTVVFVTNNLYDQTERYRVDHMLEVIESIDKWYGMAVTQWEFPILSRYIECVDLVVFSRVYCTKEVLSIIQICKQNNICTVYSLDDLVFDKKYINAAMESTGNFNKEYWVGLVNSVDRVARECDKYWVTNDFLASKVVDLYKKPVFVTKNYINKKQEKLATKYYLEKIAQYGKRDKKFTLGYFSGTGSHNYDFQLISKCIVEFMKKHRNVSLTIVGYLEVGNLLNEIDENRVSRLPFMSPCSLQREIAQVDVNLIPLSPTVFADCKSEIKFFEAAIAGTVSIMSPTYVYKALISDGAPGYVCKNEADWSNALENLYYSGNNREEMRLLHEYGIEKYSSSKQIRLVNDVLDSMYIR